MIKSNTLADLVKIFHILIILFIIIGPFLDDPMLLVLHITFCVCLMIHWLFNSDVCFLTFVEKKLRGVGDEKSFIYQFIAPMYNISNTKFNQLIWMVTIILCLISIYNLFSSEKIKLVLYELYNVRNQGILTFQKIINILYLN